MSGWNTLTGYGISWKCKICGKNSIMISDGVGVCCSPELQEQARLQAKNEQYKRDLVWALRTRVLTDEEMGQVASYDYHILVRNMVSYNETEVRKQFSDLLLAQFKLKALAARIANGEDN